MDRPRETQDLKSSEELKETSEKEPESFTAEQVGERERKARSDALADIGRYKKSAEDAIKAVKAAEERINRMLKEQEDSELAAARDEPDKLTLIRERQARRMAESDLAKVRQELSEKDERVKLLDEQEAKSTKERNTREIATRLNVDANRLAKLAKLTDGSLEAIEEIAKELPKKGETAPLRPDSGKTIGGGKTYKVGDVHKTLDPRTMTPKQIHEQMLEIEKATREGRIKE